MDTLNSDPLTDLDPDSNYYENIVGQNHIFSKFYSVVDFINESSSYSLNDDNLITVFCQNIRSMSRNLDNFLVMFPSNNMPDVFIFTETWHDIDVPINIIGYKGYHTVRCGRSGGVSIFIKNQFSSEKIEHLCYANSTIELCTIQIKNSISNFNVCGIYRPHSDIIDNFSAALESILSETCFSNQPCVIAGDLNINLLSSGVDVDRFVDMMRSHHFLQTITDITHPGNGLAASSLIDHVWINQLSSYSCGTVETGITDHHSVFIQLPFFTRKTNSAKIKINFRDYLS